MAKKGRRAANEERLVAVQMQENGMSVPEIAEIMNTTLFAVESLMGTYRFVEFNCAPPWKTIRIANRTRQVLIFIINGFLCGEKND